MPKFEIKFLGLMTHKRFQEDITNEFNERFHTNKKMILRFYFIIIIRNGKYNLFDSKCKTNSKMQGFSRTSKQKHLEKINKTH